MKTNTLHAPLASLAIDGTPPAEGDEVTVTLTARVVRLDGDRAELEPTAVNGEALPAAPAAEPDLMEMAERADSEVGGDNY